MFGQSVAPVGSSFSLTNGENHGIQLKVIWETENTNECTSFICIFLCLNKPRKITEDFFLKMATEIWNESIAASSEIWCLQHEYERWGLGRLIILQIHLYKSLICWIIKEIKFNIWISNQSQLQYLAIFSRNYKLIGTKTELGPLIRIHSSPGVVEMCKIILRNYK